MSASSDDEDDKATAAGVELRRQGLDDSSSQNNGKRDGIVVASGKENDDVKCVIEMMTTMLQERVEAPHLPPMTPLCSHANGGSRMARTTFLSTS